MRQMALKLGASLLLSVFGATFAQAGSWTIVPGSINYGYQSPTVGISAVVQVGGNPTVTVNQGNTYNISGIVQAGHTTTATTTQHGVVNMSAIAQSGRINTATVTQFGPMFSFLNN